MNANIEKETISKNKTLQKIQERTSQQKIQKSLFKS